MTEPQAAPPFPTHRIDALDVLRGFALVGICLVNVEFFNRPVAESGAGMAPGLHGLDWFAAWVVAYFVSGKFWTIFSLLFGMGFAVMLERARTKGRPFLPAYRRRIAALLVFGLLHHSLLWSGDILISYAIGALFLLLALFARGRWLLFAIVCCMALSLLPAPWRELNGLALPLAFVGLVALYLRGKPGEPGFALAMIIPGALILLAALVLVLQGSEGAPMLAVAGSILLALGLLARRRGGEGHGRLWRAGIAIFVLSFGFLVAEGGLRYFSAGSPSLGPAASTAIDGREVDQDTARSLRHRELVQRIAEERKVLTQGSYAQAVAMRVGHLRERLRDEAGFSIVLVGVFLVGVWCVRSGMVTEPVRWQSLLRRLAWIGLPLGIGVGLAGSLVATARPPGVDDQGWDFAYGLLMLGSLPASFGYMAALLLLLQRRPGLARVFAPLGRMALSNYLMQSLVLSLLFYAHGAGLWGIGRAAQVGVALALCALQAWLSAWWLRRHRYGPMEWLWRAFTYLRLPERRPSVNTTLP
ncbi:DUF418 domain-containing protein [Massilia sp. IC2-477]|uniref:DUF418 domain-containing protein n=1 Tax=Massilia sp. IC2-477 TaxID=2887198 RepID=UPI001D11D07E|nr:DUF418 domain-containing protein [Massilia sp. IC2-477]MCC2957133.1 DUF418 domain-containing protein [Massilia sp. IC2-477]